MYFHTLYNEPYLFAYSAINTGLVRDSFYFSMRASLTDVASTNYHNYNSSNSLADSYCKSFDHLLPMAVRHYSDRSNNQWYLVERPPFKTKIDFSVSKSYNKRRTNKHIQNREIWIPWTSIAINIPSNTRNMNSMKFNIFMNDTQLYSFDDTVVPSFFPNSSSNNGAVCIGNTLSNFTFDDENFSIREVSNLIFNDYFTGGWNADILSTCIYTEVFLDVFHHLETIKDKFYLSSTLPEVYQNLKTHVNRGAPPVAHSYGIASQYVEFLYAYSYLSLDQVLLYINQLKTTRKNSSSFVLRTVFPGHIASSGDNCYDRYNRLFSPYESISPEATIDKIPYFHNIFQSSEYAYCPVNFYISNNILIKNYNSGRHKISQIISHPEIISSVYMNLYGQLLSSRNQDFNNLSYTPFREYDANELFSLEEQLNV